MKPYLLPFVSLLCACAAVPGSGSGNSSATVAACPPAPGEWRQPETGRTVTLDALLDTLSGRPAVLLGETHTSPEDHRWQLHTLAALHGRTANMVMGFEAFPRRLQPVLDRWVAGEIEERAFLEQSEWDDVWGFPPPLYMPLFDFARMHRIPMVALNVERSLVARIGKEGWDAVPAEAREGIGRPAPADPSYIAALSRVHKAHPNTMGDRAFATSPEADAASPAFRRFIEAQLTWDRAMAEAIATAHARPGNPLVVAIVGRGHAEYGFGIPHQMADLGLKGAAVLVTWPSGRDCAELLLDDGTAVADAVFGITANESAASPHGPKLGVRLGPANQGVRIEEVAAGGVAAAAGIEVGDIIREAAGRPVSQPGDLAATIRRQPFGTWLPLTVERSGRSLDLVARFPAHPHPPMSGLNPHRRPDGGSSP